MMVNDLNELIVDPGDLWDRITILDIKICKLKEYKLKKLDNPELHRRRIRQVEQQYDRAKSLANKVIQTVGLMDYVTLFRLVAELRDINEVQWNLEDRVRTEESWAAAKAARDNNSKRVNLKNQINQLYGFPTEVKQYAGE